MEERKENKIWTLVEILDSGPVKITGNFTLKDLKRNTESSHVEILMCRCGKSANKPLCDDSCKHK